MMTTRQLPQTEGLRAFDWDDRRTRRGRPPRDGDTRREDATGAAAARRDEAHRLVARHVAGFAGAPAGAFRWTLGQFLGWWLEVRRIALRPRTWEGYEAIVRCHVLPSLGSCALAELSAFDLHELYADRRATGLSSSTVLRVHRVLHRALADAARWGLIPKNPASTVDAPAMADFACRTLTAEEVRSFLEAARVDRHEALFVLAITTGMRLGELLGLRWRDLELDARVVRVRRNVQWLRSGPTLLGTKTGRSRAVYLSRLAVDALHRHSTSRASRCTKTGRWSGADLVFTTGTGGPLSPSTLHTRHFRPLLERARVPRIRFHDLRHTAATLLLEQGVHPKVVSEMLGHARVGITLDIYSHVTPTLQEQAANAFDEMFVPEQQAKGRR